MDIIFYFTIFLVIVFGLGLVIPIARTVREILGQWTVDRYRSQHWYRLPKGKDKEKEEWGLIKDVLFLRKDPLVVRERKINEILKDCNEAVWMFFCLVLPLFLLLFLFLIAPKTEQFFIELIKRPEILHSIVIFVSVVIVAIGTYYTIRVNGRASSRQEWIKDVRLILAKLVSGFPEPDSDQDLCQRSKSEQQFRKLELHLNPSEKIHRSLLYAISLAYGFEWLDDEEVEKKLCLRKADDWRNSAGRKAGIIRLSQVLLKREWEQTKNLR